MQPVTLSWQFWPRNIDVTCNWAARQQGNKQTSARSAHSFTRLRYESFKRCAKQDWLHLVSNPRQWILLAKGLNEQAHRTPFCYVGVQIILLARSRILRKVQQCPTRSESDVWFTALTCRTRKKGPLGSGLNNIPSWRPSRDLSSYLGFNSDLLLRPDWDLRPCLARRPTKQRSGVGVKFTSWVLVWGSNRTKLTSNEEVECLLGVQSGLIVRLTWNLSAYFGVQLRLSQHLTRELSVCLGSIRTKCTSSGEVECLGFNSD